MSINMIKPSVLEDCKELNEYLISKGLPEELTGNPILNLGFTYKYPYHIPAAFSYPTITVQDGRTTLYGSGYYIMCYARIIDNSEGLTLKINQTQYSNKYERISKEETKQLTQKYELFRLTDALREYIDFSLLPGLSDEQINQLQNGRSILTPDEIRKIAIKFQTIDINKGLDAIIDINNFLSVEELYRLFTTAEIPMCLIDYDIKGQNTTPKYTPSNVPVDETLYERLKEMGVKNISYDIINKGPIKIKSIYRSRVKRHQ